MSFCVRWEEKIKIVFLCELSKKIAFAYNVLRLGVVPHSKNLIINHCTVSGITLNRCWAQLNFTENGKLKWSN